MWLLGWMACTTVEPTPPPEAVAVAPAKKAQKSSRGGGGKPKPKPCLPPPDVTEEAGMAASEGLSEDQVRAAMSTVFPAVAQCAAAAGASPSGALRVSITVGCGGVVSRQRVLDAADWPDDVVKCAQGAIDATPFPAHALPDGDTFEFPLSFR